jgi:hypothetical protein
MEKASDGQDGPTNDVEFSIRFTTFHRSLQHLYIPSLHSQLYNGVTADIEDVLFGTKNPDGYLYIVPRRRLPSLKSDLLMHLIICEIFHKGLEIIVPLHMLNNSRSDQRVYLILDYCQVRTVPPNRTQIWYHHHQPTNHPSIHPSVTSPVPQFPFALQIFSCLHAYLHLSSTLDLCLLLPRKCFKKPSSLKTIKSSPQSLGAEAK